MRRTDRVVLIAVAAALLLGAPTAQPSAFAAQPSSDEFLGQVVVSQALPIAFVAGPEIAAVGASAGAAAGKRATRRTTLEVAAGRGR